jgi:CheY-like chemotaxis protein
MRKILLADASAMMHRIIELTFSRENVHVISVGDGEQAIALLPIARPDIVLADHALPIRDGYEVVAFVKAHPDLAHVPVLLMAGAFEPVDRVRADQAGCDGVLVKPFEPQQVIARVRELIDARTSAVPSPVPVGARASVLKLVEPSPRDKSGSSPPPARPVGGVEGWESLDEYFDRLDAALGGLDGGHGLDEAARFSHVDRDESPERPRDDLPTVEALLGAAPVTTSEPAAVFDLLRSRAPAPAAMQTEPVVPTAEIETQREAANAPMDLNALANALGELRRNDVHPELSPLPVRADGPPDAPIITDEMIDEVTRRVAQRLAPGAVSDVVSAIVTEVAERLVHEEIERMRGK